MNWIQEQEERDYHPRSDLENAFQQSRQEIPLKDPAIAEAVGRGKHVIVLAGPAYCPSTDAILGERTSYESEHDTLEEARQIVNGEKYEWLDDDEIRVYIESPPDTVIQVRNEVTGDFWNQTVSGRILPDDEDVPF